MAGLKKRSVIQFPALFIVCIASAVIVFALRNNNISATNHGNPLAAQQSDEKVIERQENLEFTIKNTTDKQITYINYILEFTETGVGRPMMQYVLDREARPTASEVALKYIEHFFFAQLKYSIELLFRLTL